MYLCTGRLTIIQLINCGLVTPYGDIDLGQLGITLLRWYMCIRNHGTIHDLGWINSPARADRFTVTTACLVYGRWLNSQLIETVGSRNPRFNHHYLMTSSHRNIFRVTGPDRWVPSQRPVTWSFDDFFICARTTGWANNRDTGDLRLHRAHHESL